MLPTTPSRASDFPGPADRSPLSAPARRLRALRDSLRHTRLFRPAWRGGQDFPAAPAPPPPGEARPDETKSPEPGEREF